MTEQSPNYIAPPAKYLTLVFKITSAEQQTKLLAEGQWIASCHTNAMAERDALQRQAQQLQDRVQELGQAARGWKTKAEALQEQVTGERDEVEALHSYVDELEAQLVAVGAGGVESLRKRECLHQIVEPVPAAELKPVAWRGGPTSPYLARYKYTDIGLQAEAWEKQGLQVEPLYAAPQPPAPVRHPLTDDRISDIVREAAKNSPIRRDGTTSHRIVRAVEAAHGITAPKPLWLPSDDTEGGAV